MPDPMNITSGTVRAHPDSRFAIIASRWNPRIVDALVDGAERAGECLLDDVVRRGLVADDRAGQPAHGGCRSLDEARRGGALAGPHPDQEVFVFAGHVENPSTV